MENVRTGCDDCACIRATTVDESTPPDRKTPSGTSAIIRSATASRKRRSRLSTASASEPENGFASPAFTTAFADQKGTGFGDETASARSVRMQPGGSLETPS